MQIVDLSTLLAKEGELETTTLLDTMHTHWSLLRVAPQERREVRAADLEERVLVALGGCASLHLDGSRHALVSGYAVAIDPGPAFALWCEGTEPFEAILITSPRLEEAPS